MDITNMTAAIKDATGSDAVENTASGPGALRGDVSLTLHTQIAFNTFNGRRGADGGAGSVPGLLRFAAYLDQIAIGAAADDPYADATLVSVEELMDHAETTLTLRIRSFQSRLTSNSRMTIEMASSTAPHSVTLKFRSPYAHWAARLIGQFDELATLALNAHHIGIIHREMLKKTLQEGSKLIRRAIHAAGRYRFSGVSRKDLEQQTARVKEIIANRGEVPAEILSRKVSPRFWMAPRVH